MRLVATGTDGVVRTYEVVQMETGYEDYLVCYCNAIVKDEYDRYFAEVERMYLHVGYQNAEVAMKEAAKTGFLDRCHNKIYLENELPDLLPAPVSTENSSSAAMSLRGF